MELFNNMDLMEKIISLSKRRGIIFPSSDIYGGFGSSYDFGPLGVEIKRNIKEAWWKDMVQMHSSVVGLDAAILMSPKIWEASGHLSVGFADELVECKECHKRFRLSELKEEECPECKGRLTEPKQFNLMMKTFIGSLEDESAISYLRAETCQGIYVNFKNVLDSMRLKLPFGIAQIGKSFRNEITTKNFIFRMREFEQMEMQFFCDPKDADKWFDYWKEERLKWYESLGLNMDNLKIYEVPEGDRAHYAKRQIDVMYNFPFGWQEIEGIHNRGDWDLSRHSKYSGVDLSYTDPETKEKYTPYIIETSVGVERSLLAFLCDAYQEIEGGRTTTTESTKEIETVLKFHPKLAPVKIAVLPLLKNKPGLIKKSEEVFNMLSKEFICQYDEAGAIGRRYRRQDEIGTPYCITIDFDSLEKNDVTVRDRDTMEQERIQISELVEYFKEKIKD